jgi:type I restriction-modification system DNA methylase subunit
MKLYEAKNIITEVFENPFDKDKFSYFIRNLLKNIKPAEFLRAGYNIPKAFEDFIASYERIGKYEDEEGNLIDVLIIKLKRDHSIDYARSTQRNFVRWYLNDKGKDASLVAFTTEKSIEWRFSFIKMQYSLERKKDELTPAKRSSFMVGESGKSHTAQRQLVDLLKNDHAPYLSDIENAFSIEAVSDEFYEKYKALLFNLVDEIEKIVKKDKTVKEEFESKNISILNFSKKLLGQIVFLYFLQKKGWLGLEEKAKYGEGDKNFLRSLFNKTKPGENFFNDSLEYLFYDALSKKRVTDYYERFKTRIPFLNGGLFDPIAFYDWQKTDIVIPNKIFSDRKGDEEGTGILDVFDLYNFTVKEDEPLETEVAIDPEMLGKVFERMLDVTERKSKGAFYTPREIVHYMAQQCLLYFLETELQNEIVPKEDLEMFIHYGEHIIDKDIAIEEGKLSQTANKQQIPESIRQNADDIDKALEKIKICDPAVGSGAFPVGIMNEIVKLRKLLTPFLKKENAKDRSAYRFKSNAIQNSIYGVDIDAGAVEIAKLRLWLSMVVDEERIDNIEPLPNLEYKIVQGNSLINMPDGCLRNGDLETEIENLTKNYYTITDKEKKQEQKEIIDRKIKQLLVSASDFAGYNIDFDFKLFFHEVWNKSNGFDIVIGNPPFVEARKIPQYLVNIYRKAYETAGNRINTFSLFTEKGICNLNTNRIISFIIHRNSIRSNDYKKLRKYILDNCCIKEILSFKNGVFDSVTGEMVVLILKRNKENKENNLKITFLNKSIVYADIDYKYIEQSIFKELPDYRFNIYLTKDIINLIEKINNHEKLIKFGSTTQGIIVGDEKKYITKEKLKDNYRPILRGKNINRYQVKFNNEFVNYFPGTKVLKRGKTPSLFEVKQKILTRHVSSNIVATLDTQGYYYLQTINGIIINKNFSAKYILSLLNSETLNFFYEFTFNMGAEFTTAVAIENIDKLPITYVLTEVQKFEIIVDYLIFFKNQNNDKKSFFFEQLINGMVYELYFENEIKQAGCDILKYLDDLPEIMNEMDDEEKMKIITKVFNKLYDKESPVRKNLFFMDSVEEIAIIKKSLEK